MDTSPMYTLAHQHSITLIGTLVALLLLQGLRPWPRLYALVTFPATALHECAHLLMGAALGAEPLLPHWMPKRKGGRWILATTEFRQLRFYNALPVALAPLLLSLPLFFFLLLAFDFRIHDYARLAWALLLAQVLLASWPSREDWTTGLRLGWPLLLSVGVLLVALREIGHVHL